MTDKPDTAEAAGELALAIVLQDLEARVGRGDLTESDARRLVSGALDRLPPEAHPEVHALVDAEGARPAE